MRRPLHDDPDRTTPIGLVRYAHEFLLGALAVNDKFADDSRYQRIPPIPALYLAGHSLELSLKAYLAYRGVPLKTLRREYGHELHGALRKAKELGLGDSVTLDGAEEAAVEILDDLYSTKQLEYIVTGAKVYPVWGLIETSGVKVFNAVAAVVGYGERFEGYHF